MTNVLQKCIKIDNKCIKKYNIITYELKKIINDSTYSFISNALTLNLS